MKRILLVCAICTAVSQTTLLGDEILGDVATGALIGGIAGGGKGAAIGAGVGAGFGILNAAERGPLSDYYDHYDEYDYDDYQ
jgi:hypothetical protein